MAAPSVIPSLLPTSPPQQPKPSSKPKTPKEKRKAQKKKQLQQKPIPRIPKIEILQLTENVVHFKISGTDHGMVNSLRRSIIDDLPALAIDKLEIEENTSNMIQEELLQRLSFVLLKSKTSITNYPLQKDCACNSSCEKCSVELVLDVTNDDETNDRLITVADLICKNPDIVAVDTLVESDENMLDKDDQKHSSVLPTIITHNMILKLNPKGTIKLKAWAVRGYGSLHAKWITVTPASFTYIADITVNVSRWTEAQKQKLIITCPTRVFGVGNGGVGNGGVGNGGTGGANAINANNANNANGLNNSNDAKSMSDMDTFQPIPTTSSSSSTTTPTITSTASSTTLSIMPSKCMFCNECMTYAKSIQHDGDIVVRKQSDTDFLFTIVSCGVWSPQQIVQTATTLLKTQWQKFGQNLNHAVQLECRS
jgi:DNA-directed RNA polymerase alpha subunit